MSIVPRNVVTNFGIALCWQGWYLLFVASLHIYLHWLLWVFPTILCSAFRIRVYLWTPFVVNWQRQITESALSTFCRTSRGIQWVAVRKISSPSRSIGWVWDDKILPGSEDPQNVRQNKGDPKMGNLEWIMLCLIRWYRMRSIYPGVSQIYTPRHTAQLNYRCIRVAIVPVTLYTSHRSPHYHAEWWHWAECILPPQYSRSHDR